MFYEKIKEIARRGGCAFVVYLYGVFFYISRTQ